MAAGGDGATFYFDTNITDVVQQIHTGIQKIAAEEAKGTKSRPASINDSQAKAIERDTKQLVRAARDQVSQLNKAFSEGVGKQGFDPKKLTGDYQAVLNELNKGIGRISANHGANVDVGVKLSKRAVGELRKELEGELKVKLNIEGVSSVGTGQLRNYQKSLAEGHSFGSDTKLAADNKNYARNLKSAALAAEKVEKAWNVQVVAIVQGAAALKETAKAQRGTAAAAKGMRGSTEQGARASAEGASAAQGVASNLKRLEKATRKQADAAEKNTPARGGGSGGAGGGAKPPTAAGAPDPGRPEKPLHIVTRADGKTGTASDTFETRTTNSRVFEKTSAKKAAENAERIYGSLDDGTLQQSIRRIGGAGGKFVADFTGDLNRIFAEVDGGFVEVKNGSTLFNRQMSLLGRDLGRSKVALNPREQEILGNIRAGQAHYDSQAGLTPSQHAERLIDQQTGKLREGVRSVGGKTGRVLADTRGTETQFYERISDDARDGYVAIEKGMGRWAELTRTLERDEERELAAAQRTIETSNRKTRRDQEGYGKKRNAELARQNFNEFTAGQGPSGLIEGVRELGTHNSSKYVVDLRGEVDRFFKQTADGFEEVIHGSPNYRALASKFKGVLESESLRDARAYQQALTVQRQAAQEDQQRRLRSEHETNDLNLRTRPGGKFRTGVEKVGSSNKVLVDTTGVQDRIFERTKHGYQEILRGTEEFDEQATRYANQLGRARAASQNAGKAAYGRESRAVAEDERRSQATQQQNNSRNLRGTDGRFATGVERIGSNSNFVVDTRGEQDRIFAKTKAGFEEIARGTDAFEDLARRYAEQQGRARTRSQNAGKAAYGRESRAVAEDERRIQAGQQREHDRNLRGTDGRFATGVERIGNNSNFLVDTRGAQDRIFAKTKAGFEEIARGSDAFEDLARKYAEQQGRARTRSQVAGKRDYSTQSQAINEDERRRLTAQHQENDRALRRSPGGLFAEGVEKIGNSNYVVDTRGAQARIFKRTKDGFEEILRGTQDFDEQAKKYSRLLDQAANTRTRQGQRQLTVARQAQEEAQARKDRNTDERTDRFVRQGAAPGAFAKGVSRIGNSDRYLLDTRGDQDRIFEKTRYGYRQLAKTSDDFARLSDQIKRQQESSGQRADRAYQRMSTTERQAYEQEEKRLTKRNAEDNRSHLGFGSTAPGQFAQGVDRIGTTRFVADMRGLETRIYQEVKDGFLEVDKSTVAFGNQMKALAAQQERQSARAVTESERATRAQQTRDRAHNAALADQQRAADKVQEQANKAALVRNDGSFAKGIIPIGGSGSTYIADTRNTQERIFQQTANGFKELLRGTTAFEQQARRLAAQQAAAGQGGRTGLSGIFEQFGRGLTSGTSFGGNEKGQFSLETALGGVARSAGTTAKYAVLGTAFYGIQQAVAAAAQEVGDFEDSVTEMNVALDAINPNLEASTGVINKLADAASVAGTNVGEGMDLAAAAVRAFGDTTDGSQQQIDNLETSFAKSASVIATISKTDLADAAGNLRAVGQAYDLTADTFARYQDAIAGAKQVGGGNEKDIGQGIASAAVAAKSAGFTLEETATIISKIVAETDESGQLAATRFSKIASIIGGSSGKSAILQLNQGLDPSERVDTTADQKTQVQQLSSVYGKLNEAQRQQLINSLGGTANARELIILLENANHLIDEADKGFTGKGLDEYKRRLADIRATINQIQGNIKNIFAAIANSGALDPLFLLAKDALLPALQALRHILETFNLIPRPLRDAVFLMGELLLAMKAIQAITRTSLFSNVLASTPLLRGAIKAPQKVVAAGSSTIIGAQPNGRTLLPQPVPGHRGFGSGPRTPLATTAVPIHPATPGGRNPLPIIAPPTNVAPTPGTRTQLPIIANPNRLLVPGRTVGAPASNLINPALRPTLNNGRPLVSPLTGRTGTVFPANLPPSKLIIPQAPVSGRLINPFAAPTPGGPLLVRGPGGTLAPSRPAAAAPNGRPLLPLSVTQSTNPTRQFPATGAPLTGGRTQLPIVPPAPPQLPTASRYLRRGPFGIPRLQNFDVTPNAAAALRGAGRGIRAGGRFMGNSFSSLGRELSSPFAGTATARLGQYGAELRNAYSASAAARLPFNTGQPSPGFGRAALGATGRLAADVGKALRDGAATGVKGIGSALKYQSSPGSSRYNAARQAYLPGGIGGAYRERVDGGQLRRYAAIGAAGQKLGSFFPSIAGSTGVQTSVGAVKGLAKGIGPEGLALAGISTAIAANSKTKEILGGADAIDRLTGSSVGDTSDEMREAAKNLAEASNTLKQASSGLLGTLTNGIASLFAGHNISKDAQRDANNQASYLNQAADLIERAKKGATESGTVAEQIDLSGPDQLSTSLSALSDAGYTTTQIVTGLTSKLKDMSKTIVTGKFDLDATDIKITGAEVGKEVGKDVSDTISIAVAQGKGKQSIVTESPVTDGSAGRTTVNKGKPYVDINDTKLNVLGTGIGNVGSDQSLTSSVSSIAARQVKNYDYTKIDPAAFVNATDSLTQNFLKNGVTYDTTQAGSQRMGRGDQNPITSKDINNGQAYNALVGQYEKQYEKLGLTPKDAKRAAGKAAGTLKGKLNSLTNASALSNLTAFYKNLGENLAGYGAEQAADYAAGNKGKTTRGKNGYQSSELVSVNAQRDVLTQNIGYTENVIKALKAKGGNENLKQAKKYEQDVASAKETLKELDVQTAAAIVSNMQANFQLLEASKPSGDTLARLKDAGVELQKEIDAAVANSADDDTIRALRTQKAQNVLAQQDAIIAGRIATQRNAIDPRDEVANADQDLKDAQTNYDHLIKQDYDPKGQTIQQAILTRTQAKFAAAQARTARDIAKQNQNAFTDSPLDTATRALADARRNLKDMDVTSTAYYNQLAAINQAEQELAKQKLAATNIKQQLAIDLTNPVQVANQAVDAAKAELERVKKQYANAPKDVRNEQVGQATLNVRTAQNSAEAAEFQQFLSSTQTANDLGRISHQAYMSLLKGRRAQLSTELATLDPQTNMYQQIKDQIDQLDQALKASADELSGQFNIGDIKVPTPYEVRKAIKDSDIGTIGRNNRSTSAAGNTVNDSSSQNITLNGVPIEQVLTMIQNLFGKKVRTQVARKVVS